MTDLNAAAADLIQALVHATEDPPYADLDSNLTHRLIVEAFAALVIDAETEQALRAYLWLSHGHTGQYGDDGEMQCAACAPMYDYKRSPLKDVITQALKARSDVNLAILSQPRAPEI